jgi:SulP family sulfate permease
LMGWLRGPTWWRADQRRHWAGDAVAGAVVTVLVIPQSLAYAMLAGLPPTMGLYASVWPVLAYAFLGSSQVLAVGPVAVTSLMTASALLPLAVAASPEYVALAMGLALLSGLMLTLAGVLRLGFLAYFLSQPVISGFVSGVAILIAIGQLPGILGITVAGRGVAQTLLGVWQQVQHIHVPTAALGLGAVGVLWWARSHLARAWGRWFGAPEVGAWMARMAPLVVVLLATLIVLLTGGAQALGVAVVGPIEPGLPQWQGVFLDSGQWLSLCLPALLIALIGFVESVSLAQAYALQRQQRLAPNRELLGLGVANVLSGFTGGYSVAGGFSRTVINASAGAQTPMASVVAALLMAGVMLGFSQAFEVLPVAVLSASILVSVLTLIDVQTLRQAWRYDTADAWSWLATFAGVLVAGVEIGIGMGVVLSLGVLVWRSSRPHMAVVGRIAGTEHFRNIERHRVETLPGLIALRVDESLFFANAAALEEKVGDLLSQHSDTRCLLLILSAVNRIDTTALIMLDELERSLALKGVQLWLTEVKGPVMDRLGSTDLGQRLASRIYLSTNEAFNAHR